MSLARRTRSVIPLAAALAALAACKDGSGPAPNFDPVATHADAQVMMTAFDVPTLRQFLAVSGYMNLDATPAAAAVRGARELLAGGRYVTGVQMGRVAGAVAEGLLKSTSGTTGMTLSRAASLPAEVLGTTFVFDPSGRQYVASGRTGAPANGVRFVLYAINPLTYEPIVETEVGHADVIDLNPSGTNSAGIRLVVFGGSTTYLDYSVTATAGLTSGTVAITGYLTDGTTRVDFNTGMSAAQQSNGTSTFNVEYAYDVPSRQFGVRGAIEGYSNSDTAFSRMTLTTVSPRATVKYVFEGDVAAVDVSVYIDNRLFATITGNGETVTIRGAGGRQLTQNELQALHKLLNVAQYSYYYFVGLVAPVGMLGSNS